MYVRVDAIVRSDCHLVDLVGMVAGVVVLLGVAVAAAVAVVKAAVAVSLMHEWQQFCLPPGLPQGLLRCRWPTPWLSCVQVLQKTCGG